MAAADQFVDELGVTAVNAAQIEETLLHKVICPMLPGCAAFSLHTSRYSCIRPRDGTVDTVHLCRLSVLHNSTLVFRRVRTLTYVCHRLQISSGI